MMAIAQEIKILFFLFELVGRDICGIIMSLNNQILKGRKAMKEL